MYTSVAESLHTSHQQVYAYVNAALVLQCELPMLQYEAFIHSCQSTEVLSKIERASDMQLDLSLLQAT